jgi:hypothetical protein
MVEHIPKSELKQMSNRELRVHAARLLVEGYMIPSDFKKLKGQKLYRAIDVAQKLGPNMDASSEEEPDLDDEQEEVVTEVLDVGSGSDCALPSDMINQTQCYKNYDPTQVRGFANACGVDYTNKRSTCGALMDAAGISTPRRSASPRPKKKRRSPKKKPRSPKKKRAASPKAPKASPAAATTKAELMKLLKKDLVALTKKANLPYSNRNKGDLVAQLLLHRKKGSPPASPKRRKKASPKRRKKASPKRRKKASPPKAPSVSLEEEEEVGLSASMEGDDEEVGLSASMEEQRSCGAYDYEQLISKRLDELRAILREKGIKAGVTSQEEAADYICADEMFGKCNVKDDFGCPSGSRCEIDPSMDGTGQCLPDNMDRPAELVYQGKTIVGSQDAITALRRKLGLTTSGRAKPLNPKTEPQRQKLIAKAVMVSGRDASSFATWRRGQLTMFIEQFDIVEDRGKDVLISEIVSITQAPASRYEKYSKDVLVKRLAKLRAKQAAAYQPADQGVGLTAETAENMSKEQLAVYIVANSKYKSVSSLTKKRNKTWLVAKALEVSGEVAEEIPPELPAAVESEGVSDIEEAETVIERPPSPRRRRRRRKKPSVRRRRKKHTSIVAADYDDDESSGDSDEDEPLVPPKATSVDEVVEDEVEDDVDLSSEEAPVLPAAPVEQEEDVVSEEQEEISTPDVQQVLGNVMAGQTSQIENLTQAQNAVLKCLGLAS